MMSPEEELVSAMKDIERAEHALLSATSRLARAKVALAQRQREQDGRLLTGGEKEGANG